MVLCGTIMDIKKGGPAPAFEIQIRTPKGWSNDLWGCDVGNQAVPETIKTGDVEEFRIKLHEQGTYRLRLYYIIGTPEKAGDHCEGIIGGKSHQVATSREFRVTAK
jgi:hypothetical protein